MMFGNSDTDSWSGLWFVGMHVHMFFGLLLFFAILAGVVWLFRFANAKELKKFFWTGAIVGILGLLITAPLAYWGMNDMMQKWEENRGNDEDNVTSDTTTPADTTTLK